MNPTIPPKVDLTPYQTNHLLHLLLSIVTGGLWLIVWFFVAAADREMREALIRASQFKTKPKPKRSELEKTLIGMFVVFMGVIIFMILMVFIFLD